MRIAVRRFQDADATAIGRFNERLEAGACAHRLYKEDLSGNPTADLGIRPINDSLYVAVDGDEVRGGSWLREQYFWVDGSRHRIGWMKYPVAESLVDPRYAGVAGSMILQLLRQQPNLMALGMGGHDAPFARLLKGIKWRDSTIPFLFRMVRPFRVLRGLAYARQRRWLRIAMDLAAWSGAGWLSTKILHATAHRVGEGRRVVATVEQRFTPWADPIWEAFRDEYAALAVRDAKTLDYLYPSSFAGMDRLRIARGASDVGWICAQVLPATEGVSAYFGALKVGVLTDALAHPRDASVVLRAGLRHLERLGVDLIVTYLSHAAWTEAARALRFLPGPSNFVLYQSPRALQLLVDGGTLAARCHLTRSDCDGPYSRPPDGAG